MTPLMILAARVEEGPLRWASLPPPWLLTVIIIVGFVWIRSIYAKERGRAGPWTRLGLSVLRTIILICVILVMGGPYRQEERRAVERSHLVVLVDASASMKVADKYPPSVERRLLDAAFPPNAGPRPSTLDDTPRADLVRAILAPKGESLLRTWAERFVLHVFAFDGDWRSLGSTQPPSDAAAGETTPDDLVKPIGDALRGMTVDGGRTRLGAVLRNVTNEFARRQDQHLAGVVLISDGRDTSDGEPPQQVLAAMGPIKEKLHVAAIGLGNPASGKDLWVDRIRSKEVVLVRDNVVFETALRHTDLEGRGPVSVSMEIFRVADEQGRREEPRPYAVPPSAEAGTKTRIEQLPEGATPIRLQAPLNETGTFRVWIRAKFENTDDARLDSVPGNDARWVDVLVKDQRIKVLYIDNLPRHDWRFLSNYLTREPGHLTESRMAEARSRFQVHVLLQSADPAFRQPASIGLKPLRHFPSRREELFDYDVIIWGDVDLEKLDPANPGGSKRILQLVADFVEQGGGLALQAGVDYHTPLDLLGTPLAPLLPLNVRRQDRLASESEMDRSFRLRLTDAGAVHPIFAVVPGKDGGVPTTREIRNTWSGDSDISHGWAWYWLYRAGGGLRPGAVDLARVRLSATDRDFRGQRGEPLVVLATMGYGKGQVFWSSLDTLSRLRRAQRDRIYGAFWEQVIRYLATYRLLGGNRRFKIFTDEDSYFVGQTAQVTITALDDKFQPLDDEFLDGVHIEMGDDPTSAESRLLEGDARPRSMREDGAAGTYSLMLPLKKKGLVRIWIDRMAPGAGRAGKDRAEKRFEVTFRAREDVLKVPDHATLKDIVAATNPKAGEPVVHALDEIGDVVAGMQARPRERVLSRRERTQWDKTWVLLLITGLLAIEWLWRKRLQMI